MSQSIIISVPQPNIPFLDEYGNVSRAWFYFLLGIFNRTGGGTPTPPVPILIDQINALFVEAAMVDDNPQPKQISPFLSSILDDSPQPKQVNPFLAALMVAE